MNTKGLMTIAAATAVLAGALLAAGCGKEREAAKAPAAQSSPVATPAARPASAPAPEVEVTSPDGGVKPLTGEAFFSSPEGRFKAIYPAGCGRIATRVYPQDLTRTPPQNVRCMCDLGGDHTQGTMVGAYFAVRAEGGGLPDPRNVTTIIEDLVRRNSMQIVQQSVVQRPDYQGVRLFCRQPNGPSEMWAQGVLAGERIYILSAWRPAGGSLTDEQIIRFFDSFRLEP